MKRVWLAGILAAVLPGVACAQGPIPDPWVPNNYVVTPAPGGGANALGYNSASGRIGRPRPIRAATCMATTPTETIGHITGAPTATGTTARSRVGRRAVTPTLPTFADIYSSTL